MSKNQSSSSSRKTSIKFDKSRSKCLMDTLCWSLRIGPIPEKRVGLEWERFVMNFGLQFIGTRPIGLDMDLAQKRNREGKPPAVAAGCRVNCAFVSSAIIGWMFNRGNLPLVPTTIHLDMLAGKVVRTGPKKRWIMKKVMARKFRER